MTEFSESIYIRGSKRARGVQWLRDNDLAGYALEPRGEWIQVFPDWNHLSDDESRELLANSSGLLIHYYYAEDQFWAFSVYQQGDLEFRYESIWLVDEYVAEGRDIDEVADILEVPADDLGDVIRDSSESPSWDELAEDAARLADLLKLPNYAFASFMHAEDMGLEESYAGPETGWAAAEGIDGDDANEEADGAGEPGGGIEIPDEIDVPEPPESVPDGADAPWQRVYELASYFLKGLHEQELIELTVDNRLARDRLIERLTKTFIDNPVSGDSQLLGYWFDELMTCPEIVDVFATDDMLEDVYRQAKDEVDDQSTAIDEIEH